MEAQGFEPQQNDAVAAGLGQKQTVDFMLKVAQAKENIEVNGEAAILNPENANTSTTLSAPALENLPNPGGDLTYPLQFATGALINTAGSGNDFVGGTNGYGNVEFNGLPALSNGYIVDGLETNDPLTNLNSGLSTNLVLGLNSISEVTVNTLSYAVDQGRYGASQVNYVTKSGSNQFHGNLYELWNGARLERGRLFHECHPGNHKPGSTVNHFGGSIGGPIVRDKLFFFFDSEWVRIALPIVTPPPCHGFISELCFAATPHRRYCPLTGNLYPAAPANGAVLREDVFALRKYVGGTPLAVLGCPFDAGGSSAPGAPTMETAARIARAFRIRATIMSRSRRFASITTSMRKTPTWFAFRPTPGVQAAYTDPINPLFNSVSPQPLVFFCGGIYARLFAESRELFQPGIFLVWSLFGPSDFQKTLAAFPIVLQGTGANAIHNARRTR